MSDINMGHIDFGIFIVFVLLSILTVPLILNAPKVITTSHNTKKRI